MGSFKEEFNEALEIQQLSNQSIGFSGTAIALFNITAMLSVNRREVCN
jgi:hypothetical protein